MIYYFFIFRYNSLCLTRKKQFQVEIEKLFYCFYRCIKEQTKAHNRELRRTDRDLVRDRHQLEHEEQRIVKLRFLFSYLFIYFFLKQK